MIDTQCAMNTGIPVAPQVEAWLAASSTGRDSSVVDPFIGCSVVLPSLMVRPSRFNLTIKLLRVEDF